MFHTLLFHDDLLVDLVISRKQPLAKMQIQRGSRLMAEVKPYIREGDDGPVEVADLFFADGTFAVNVPFEHFCFVDQANRG